MESAMNRARELGQILRPLWAPLLGPFAILATCCLLSAMILTSCAPREQDVLGELARPVDRPGARRIGVLLTNTPRPVVRLECTGGYILRSDEDIIAASQGPPSPIVATHTGGEWSFNGLKAPTGTVTFEPMDDALVALNGVSYRGTLELIPANADTLRVVNHVPLEQYLASVIAKELYADWAYEAYRAQAVVARTFALYQAKTYGKTRDHDVRADQSSQAYPGAAGETDKSRRAVRTTAGVVLTYPIDGQPRLFRAQYSSCCGGRVNPAEVVQNSADIPPLRGGQVCTDCGQAPFASSKYRWPTVTIRNADVFDAILRRYPRRAGRLVGVDRVVVSERTDHGRPLFVKAYDTRGRAVRMRADDLRICLLYAGIPAAKRLYSMNCSIVNVGDSVKFTDGRGFGHGIGMCQYGAQSKAAKGWMAREILDFYYPGSKLLVVGPASDDG
jgi:stage II sporulation protein D